MATAEEDWSALIRWALVHKFDGSRIRLAAACGVNLETVGKWMKSQRGPRRADIRRYADALGVSFERATLAGGRVVLDNEPPLRVRLAECQAECVRLRQEVEELRSQLRAPPRGTR